MKYTHFSHMPETQKSDIIAKCQQSVTTSRYFFCQDTLDIFNANRRETTANTNSQTVTEFK